MAKIDVHTHLMPALKSVAKEIAVRTTHEELCDPEARERLTLTVVSDEGAWTGLDPEQVALRHLVRTSLDDAAAAAQKAFGPGAVYRVVLELLVGTPHGNRIEYASNRTEIITD